MLINKFQLDEYALIKKSIELRVDVIKTLSGLPSGHTGGPLGMADIFASLFFHYLGIDPNDPQNDQRDRFILSNGHICPLLYVTMAHIGLIPTEELKTLRKINSRLQGHPHNLSLSGIENSSGPLGQGISQALGFALRAKLDNLDYRVVCVCSDGENEEGQFWEALLFANKYKLDNLFIIVDKNNIQIDGTVDTVMPIDPLDKKYESFNLDVFSVNGNNINNILSVFDGAFSSIGNGKPKVIIANTILGFGVPFMENNYEWHGKAPTVEEAEEAIKYITSNK